MDLKLKRSKKMALSQWMKEKLSQPLQLNASPFHSYCKNWRLLQKKQKIHQLLQRNHPPSRNRKLLPKLTPPHPIQSVHRTILTFSNSSFPALRNYKNGSTGSATWMKTKTANLVPDAKLNFENVFSLCWKKPSR